MDAHGTAPASHEEWERARVERDRCAVACTRAQLAGRHDDAARYAERFAGADAVMARIERALDG